MGSNIQPVHTEKLHPGEAGRLVSNPDKCMKILNWKPTINLEDGMKTTIEYYLKHNELHKSLDVVVQYGI